MTNYSEEQRLAGIRATIYNWIAVHHDLNNRLTPLKQLHEFARMYKAPYRVNETIGKLTSKARELEKTLKNIYSKKGFGESSLTQAERTAYFGNIGSLKKTLPPLVEEINRLSEEAKNSADRIKEEHRESYKAVFETAHADAIDIKEIIDDALNEKSEAFSLIEALRKVKRTNGLTIIEPKTDLTLFGRKTILVRILENLVKNAGEHSAKKIRIVTERKIAKPGRKIEDPHVIIPVSDDGLGIPKELHGKIFEPWFTTVKPRTGQKGTGIGLGFCKSASKLFQTGGKTGDITVKSEPSEKPKLGNTIFTVKLPIHELPETKVSGRVASMKGVRKSVRDQYRGMPK